MKLYTNWHGQWAGTQADAKQMEGEAHQFDVPTDKPSLLSFLNKNMVGSTKDWAKQVTYIDKRIKAETSRHPLSCSANDLNGWDVKDVVLNCRKEHLGQALAAIISRLYDEIEEAT